MREIKYQALSLNGQWISGEPHVNCKTPHIHNGPLKVQIVRDTVSEFTGLKDADGYDLYENHIIVSSENPEIRHFIIYDEEEASFMAVLINEYANTDLRTSCHLTKSWIEEFGKRIIGNIFQDEYYLKLINQ